MFGFYGLAVALSIVVPIVNLEFTNAVFCL
jgi:hypothetical protein